MTAAGEGRRLAAAILAAFVLAATVHALAAWQYREDPFRTTYIADAAGYDQQARELARDGLGAQPSFHQAPLFPLLLAGVHAIGGEPDTPRGVALALSALLGSAAIALLVPLGRALFGSTGAGLAAAGLVLGYGPLTFHDLKLLPTALALATQSAGLLALVLARRRGSAALVGAAGAAWGLACLARTEMLAFVPIGLATLLVGAPRPFGRRVGLASLWLAGAALAIAPVTLHNLRQGEAVLIAANGGENLWVGNRPDGSGGHAALDPRATDFHSQRRAARALAEAAAGRELGAREISAWWTWRTLAGIRDDPASWLRLELRKLGRVLAPGEPTDLYSFALERELYLPLLRFLALTSWALLALGVAGFAWSRPFRGETWPLAALIVVQLGVLLAFFVDSRLRVPFLFFTTPFGGYALVEALRRIAAGRRRTSSWVALSIAAAGLVGGAWFTSATPRDRVRLAAILSVQGRLEPGLAVLGPAIGPPQPDPVALDQAGWLEERRGRLEAAEAHYRAALARGLPAGRVHQTHTRLAGVLERLGRVELAAAEHDLAVASPAPDAGSYYERGVFRLRHGDAEGAVRDLREAARLDPSWPAPREALEHIDGARAFPAAD